MGEKVLLSKKEEIRVREAEKNMILEYYLLGDGTAEKNYGFEIIKKERLPDGSEEIKERYIRNNIKSEYKEVGEIIKLLARNKVTPVTADNIFEDMEL